MKITTSEVSTSTLSSDFKNAKFIKVSFYISFSKNHNSEDLIKVRSNINTEGNYTNASILKETTQKHRYWRKLHKRINTEGNYTNTSILKETTQTHQYLKKLHKRNFIQAAISSSTDLIKINGSFPINRNSLALTTWYRAL